MAEAMATKYLLLFIGRYKKILGLSKFASFDESQIHSEVTALRSIVMADHTPFSPETIKILATEPVQVVGRSQIQEFMDFYRGEGIQHMALLTSDILLTIASLHARGVEFLKCPPKTYYDRLRKVLADNCENESIPRSKKTSTCLRNCISCLIMMKTDTYFKSFRVPCKIGQQCSLRSLSVIATMALEREILRLYFRP